MVSAIVARISLTNCPNVDDDFPKCVLDSAKVSLNHRGREEYMGCEVETQTRMEGDKGGRGRRGKKRN